MQRMLGTVLLATLALASAAHAAPALPGAAIVMDQFSVIGIKVDATASSPRTARELAMREGRPLAWSTLFRRFTGEPAWAAQPLLLEPELLGLILTSEASNERRNTTRYTADVTFHFNPAAVRHLLQRSNIVFTEAVINTAGEWEQSFDLSNVQIDKASTHLAVTARFDTVEDWATLRAQLGIAKAVTGMDVVGRTLHEAQIYLTHSGSVKQLQAALAQQALELTSSEGEHTLELGAVSKATTVRSR